ncbi:MAG: hypothetical protein NT124_01820 [Candidatus Dependentiae bacterium]|nr:hypothetical protein [Candidatus Dependentiae bacterium]
MQIRKVCILALVMGVMAGFSPLAARQRKRNQKASGCDVVVQDVIVQAEPVEVPTKKRLSRFARRHRDKQEKRNDLQDLTGQLQELMVINPMQKTSAGFVRTSDQNRLLAIELHNLAAQLTDAGFKLNMAHVQAKMDEFNEVPGSASGIARECTFHAQQMQQAIADLTKQRNQVIAAKDKKIKELASQKHKAAAANADTIKKMEDQLKVAQETILNLTGKLNSTLEAKEVAEKQVAQAHEQAREQAQAHAIAQARAAAQAEAQAEAQQIADQAQQVADQAQAEEQKSEAATPEASQTEEHKPEVPVQTEEQTSEVPTQTEEQKPEAATPEAAQTEEQKPEAPAQPEEQNPESATPESTPSESAQPEVPGQTEETTAETPAQAESAAAQTDTATPDWHKEQAPVTQK